MDSRIKDILGFFRDNPDYVSGDYISGRLGISRTAVWKYIHQLEEKGYRFIRLKGRGYKLGSVPDRLYPWEIERYLDTMFIGKRFIYKEAIDSTNTYAFKLAMEGAVEGTCVIAETQIKGKGRLERAWFSPSGSNLYLSVILRPKIHPSNVYPITFISSLSVSDTILSIAGITPELKWPNDVLIKGKKVSGTLLELSTEADVVRFVIIGIGLNINMNDEAMPEDIRSRATSLYMETKKRFDRPYVCATLLSKLERYYMVFIENGEGEICRMWEEKANIKGRYMEVEQMGKVERGICEGIDDKGAILLDSGGKIKRVIAGDMQY